MIQSVNPATEKSELAFAPVDSVDLGKHTDQAHQQFHQWRTVPLEERTKLVLKLADNLERQSDQYCQLMVREMGKTIRAARAEIEKCVQYCRYMADHGGQYLCDTPVQTQYKQAFTRPLPIGIILMIMPWNFPIWQVLRVAVPTLLAGNTCLLKHAPNVPQCAQALDDLFKTAGFPLGCFTNVFANHEQCTALIADPRVQGVSLTGSPQTGQAIGALCGKSITTSVLELGGSDPFIVMPSADLSLAVQAALISRIRNNGQSCIAAKRLIVHADIYDDFRAQYITGLNQLIIGDPMAEDTDLGPLVHARALTATNAMINKAVEQGAQLTQSDHELPPQGFFIKPALLENMDRQMDIYSQEIFAPIAMLYRANSFEQAIHIANDSAYGLSSVLFSQNETEIETAMTELQAGSTFINRYSSSDIRLPFGGTKASGFGREMAQAGLREFTNLKTIIVAE